ncbi:MULTISPECIES: ATP-binding protein [unclassified Oceanispirochaeta]|uniref:ATP-binding protein n=1 Tax=unclassified Oceanispirochaeta TaxID=2635722 RepID=UPI000E094077|nr:MULTISPECIES: AAA family ATPase [unclassified Oceanispirochaeta]MBF9017779.1 ATP-binding protein [Oceanispirochaeta sp. M2]NPD74343.1 ATP-binding protein [Oceanispirochaeta sp. M1]RDG29823.1 DUF4143 domain-containing protein [Oceanispirochaeta sp. M1]
MYRNALKDLNAWFDSPRRKPMILRGARQVGKSTLVRLFAKEHNLKLYELNLEKYLSLDKVFKTMNLESILLEIEGICGSISSDENALLFLDEIQSTPYALQALRYFYEEKPELAVIAAGSLLEFTLSDHSFSMPVGRITYYHLGPMSFDEFLLHQDEELHGFYKEHEPGDLMADSRHQALLKYQRDYLYCGGMPEAVLAFQEDPYTVSDVHRSLIDTYQDDFAKYARKSDLIRLQQILNRIPLQVGKKIKYVHLSPDDKAAEVRRVLDLLSKAKLCSLVYHSDCSGIPLRAGRNERVFKILFLDIGLMNHLTGLNWDILRKMDERTLINEGSIAEQFIGQELLLYYHHELHYWLREGKSNNAEVDYVIPHEGKLIPIEVKAGKSGTLKSLHQFMSHKGENRAIRFDMNKPSFQMLEVQVQNKSQYRETLTFSLQSLPLYFAGRLSSIINQWIK